MATTGEGSYEGGVGGKFRKKPLRRTSATPYDRPSTASRRTSEAGKTTWLVQPASRIISASAHRFFSSFWSNSRGLPSGREGNHEVRNNPVAVSHIPSEAKEHVSNEGDTLHNSSDTIVLNDLEQILRQKTFTRAEIDRLTEVLRSRTVDPSTADKTSSPIVANTFSPTAEMTKSSPVAISSPAVPLQFKSTTLPAPSTSALLSQTASVLESTSSELKTKHTSSPFTFGGTASALLVGKTSSPIINLFPSSNTSVAASSGSLFSSQASTGVAIAPSTSMPLQFSSSPSPSFGSSGFSFSSGNSVFGSASGSKMFGSSSTFGTTFSMSSRSFSSSSSSSASGIFTSQSTTPFRASSAAVGSASVVAPSFGSSSSSAFSFNAATCSAPNSSPFSVFSTPVLGFSQRASLPPANLTFGSPAPSNLFQMNGQQTPVTQQNPFAPAITQSPSPFRTPATQNPSPFGTTPTQNIFQASGSLGGFSLGTRGGGDTSNRRIIKVSRQDRPRKR